jgi:hypothetical protein
MTTTSQTTFRDECDRVDKDRHKREWVYEFSNGRKFDNTDNTDSGIYDGS